MQHNCICSNTHWFDPKGTIRFTLSIGWIWIKLVWWSYLDWFGSHLHCMPDQTAWSKRAVRMVLWFGQSNSFKTFAADLVSKNRTYFKLHQSAQCEWEHLWLHFFKLHAPPEFKERWSSLPPERIGESASSLFLSMLQNVILKPWLTVTTSLTS